MSHSPKDKLICFDLEGPLSPQDNAYEVMSLFPNGKEVFEVISYYDDILTLQEKLDYEPGDTLSLIVPFLIHHRIDSEKITAVSKTANIVDGAADLVSWLKAAGWQVRIISTSYSQHAITIADRIGIEPSEVACTELEIDEMIKIFTRIGTSFIDELENEIMAVYPPEEHPDGLQELFDDFYWSFLPRLDLGKAVKSVRVMGGNRKLEAANSFARSLGVGSDKVVAVGDSITDFKMLEGIKAEGGLAIAFNANEYALPYASVGLASTSLEDLHPLLEIWGDKGFDGAKDFVSERAQFQWIEGLHSIKDAIALHKECRKIVRGEASRLG